MGDPDVEAAHAQEDQASRDWQRRVRDLEAERDRLRAVVTHLRKMAVDAIDHQDRDDEYDEGNVAAWTYVRNVIDGKAGTDG